MGRRKRRGALQLHERDNATRSAWAPQSADLCGYHRFHSEQSRLCAGKQGMADRVGPATGNDPKEIARSWASESEGVSEICAKVVRPTDWRGPRGTDRPSRGPR